MREAGSQSSFDTTCRAHDGPKEETREGGSDAARVQRRQALPLRTVISCTAGAALVVCIPKDFLRWPLISVMALAVTRGRFL
uniref:Uncharacterized protein n=1 Tax=Oryza glumipatula TaxID=40148 RepID=A0A0D9YWJ3_9ORYZ